MIGRSIEVHRPLLTGAIVWFVVAAGLAGVTVLTRQPGWIVFAILPAAVGLALLLSLPPEFHAEVTPNELLVYSHQLTIPYHDIRRVWFSSHQADAVYLTHAQGVLRIPKSGGVSAFDIYSFLCRMQPPLPPADVQSSIRDFYFGQMNTFGADRVWAHNARAVVAESEGRRPRYVTVALLATCVLWLVAAAILQEGAWAGGALLMLLVTLLVLLIQGSLATTGRGIKNWRQSSVVISPAGMALAQGDLTGQMRWNEVRDVKFKDRKSTAQRKIEMKVEGALISVMDLYDSPLSEIHRQIMHYWQAG